MMPLLAHEQLPLSSREDEVRRIREDVRRTAEDMGFAVERAYDVCVAASEAVLNAWDAAAGTGLAVSVDIIRHENRLEVAVEGPGAFRLPAGQEGAWRGSGIPLMASLADEFELEAGKNRASRVTLRFLKETSLEREANQQAEAGNKPAATSPGAAAGPLQPEGGLPQPGAALPEIILQRFEALARVSEAAVSSIELDELLPLLVARSVEVLRADAGILFLLQDNWLVARASVGMTEEVRSGFRLRVGSGFAGRVAQEAETLFISDLTAQSEVKSRYLQEKGFRALLGVPLFSQGRLMGVLHVDWLQPRPYNRDEVVLLELVADRCSLAIANARLHEETRAAAEKLAEEQAIMRAIMANTTTGLAYLDSHMVYLWANEEYGRQTGIPPGELVGENHFQLFPDPDNQAIFKAARDGCTPVDYRAKPLGHLGGEEEASYWDWSLTPICQEGRTEGLVFSLHDVTERTRQRILNDAFNDLALLLGSSLDLEKTMPEAVRRAATALGASGVAVGLRVGDAWDARYAWGLPGIQGRRLTDEDLPIAAQALGRRQTIVVEDAEHDAASNRALAAALGVESFIVVPLIVRNRVTGVLYFTYRRPQRLAGFVADFASKLGSAISFAFENARLYQEERDIARSLQEGLLTVPERIPGVSVAHMYRSATTHAMVGGDFYDLFPLAGDRTAVMIGDVVGHGVQAATQGALVRNTVRAFCLDQTRPDVILEKANRLLTQIMAESGFATVFLGILEGQASLRYCMAGHPPGIIRDTAGGLRQLTCISPVMGMFPDARYVGGFERFGQGDFLFLYTDGLIEARAKGQPGGKLFGERRLIQAIAQSSARSAEGLVRDVLGQVLHFSAGHLGDDLAMLALLRT